MVKKIAFFGVEIEQSYTKIGLYINEGNGLALVKTDEFETSRGPVANSKHLAQKLEQIIEDLPRERRDQVKVKGTGIGTDLGEYDDNGRFSFNFDIAAEVQKLLEGSNKRFKEIGPVQLYSSIDAEAMGHHMLGNYPLPLLFVSLGRDLIDSSAIYANGRIVHHNKDRKGVFHDMEGYNPGEENKPLADYIARRMRQMSGHLRRNNGVSIQTELIGGDLARERGVQFVDDIRRRKGDTATEVHHAFNTEAPTLGAAVLAQRSIYYPV